MTESTTPVGAAITEVGNPLLIGGGNTVGKKIKDVHVWNRALTAAEATTSAGNPDASAPETTMGDGLVFQGPCIRDIDDDYFEDRTLTADDRLIDNQFGVVGDLNSGTVVTRLIP